jgi:hypothetical protein
MVVRGVSGPACAALAAMAKVNGKIFLKRIDLLPVWAEF